MYCLNQRLEQPALTKEQQGICTYNCIYRLQQPAYTKEQQRKIMYNVEFNYASYLHHGNQGPHVGKFKSEFPSDFHISKMSCFPFAHDPSNHGPNVIS